MPTSGRCWFNSWDASGVPHWRLTRRTISDSEKRRRMVSFGSARDMSAASACASADESSSPSMASNASTADKSNAGSPMPRATLTASRASAISVVRPTDAVQRVRPRNQPERFVLRSPFGLTLTDTFAGLGDGVRVCAALQAPARRAPGTGAIATATRASPASSPPRPPFLPGVPRRVDSS